MSDLDKALQNPESPELADNTKSKTSSALRKRLMASATLEGRFDRFLDEAQSILDLGKDETKALLDRIDAEGSFGEELPGVDFFWLPGGPRTADAVRGFVRVKTGSELPEHEHLGDEEVLVMQGTYVDARTGERYGPGSRIGGKAGTTHEFRVGEGGTDLLLLIVVHVGYRIGDMLIEPRE